MRSRIIPALLLLVIFPFVGCETIKQVDQPRERLAIATASYTAALKVLTSAAAADLIPSDVIVSRIEPIRKSARIALDVAKEAIETDSPDVLFYIDQAVANVGLIKTIAEEFSQ